MDVRVAVVCADRPSCIPKGHKSAQLDVCKIPIEGSILPYGSEDNGSVSSNEICSPSNYMEHTSSRKLGSAGRVPI